MEEIINNQKSTADKIDQLYNNYKKDSATRKTKRYLEEKIATLKQIYNDYVTNDDRIRSFSLDQSHQYFKERQDTRNVYETFIADMRTRLNGAPTTPTIPLAGQPGTSFTLTSDDNSTKPIFTSMSNLQQMLKQQDFRIRALYREIMSVEEILENNRSRPALALKQKKMENMMLQITDLNEKICMNATEQDEADSIYFIENHYETISSRYDNIAVHIATEMEQESAIKPMKIKLKPVEIPLFHGDYTKWVGFADTFKTLVHNNKQLTSTHKMNYLKTHVVGTASKLLSHLEVTGNNYEAAWEILENRFNNKRLLVSTLLNTMLNLPSSNAESANAVKQLHDTTTECLHAIRNLGIDTDSWSPFIILIISKKLDYESRRLYENSLDNPRAIQSTSQFLNFLERRFQSLETAGAANRSTPSQQPPKRAFITTTKPPNTYIICVCCQKSHKIDTCSRFKGLNHSEKSQMVMLHNLCRLCLSQDHTTVNCRSNMKCSSCKGGHHTLLHLTQQDQGISSMTKLNITSKTNTDSNPVLLATALVKVGNIHGGFNILRTLIDPGSQATFITEDAAQQLGLPRTRVIAEVSGISASKGNSHHQITIDVLPRFPSLFKTQTQALVLKTITKPLPDKTVIGLSNEIQDERLLADPTFDRPGPIDMLLGADVYGGIILEGIKKDPFQNCIAQKTELGWIISGRLNLNNKAPVKKLHSLITLADIDKQLKLFWESEELHPQRTLTTEEIQCEEHYMKTYKRLQDGRYEVKIPFNSKILNEKNLGESKQRAAARLIHMEKRFKREAEYKKAYHKFMNEYIQLKHMEQIHDNSTLDPSRTYYLPHHAVMKTDSTTTKLRVVFDASCKTTTNVSLNDLMFVGPTIQDDLVTILIRWRKYRYAFTADIEKMFRQINIAEPDSNYQLILWRPSENQKIQTYRLNTVTYGTASATYLATRTLKQLALDDAAKYPVGSKLALRDFYVDDLLTGAHSLEGAITAQKQIFELLSGGGFNLRKWNSNNKEIIKHLSCDYKESGLHPIDFDNTVKTLGLYWNSSTDVFQIKVTMPKSGGEITKRNILSDASKIFDPLGWLAPVVITSKILLQDLWASGIDWDVKVQPSIENKWLSYKDELPDLEKITINRWINYTENSNMELHGFCDASSQAYAAIVYAKSKTIIRIIAAKTKVAPLNQTISLPRLELNAALLLSKLLIKVKSALDFSNENKTYCWTDSMAVLGWIKGKPQNYKTFVANRITEIQSSTHPSQWHHVASCENPADCASRGLNPKQLINHPLWWEGPTWLKLSSYPITSVGVQELRSFGADAERKPTHVLVSTIEKSLIDFERFSSIVRLVRSIAYCSRFLTNLKTKTRDVSHLKPEELKAALKSIIIVVQLQCFGKEIDMLNNKRSLSKDSTIITLNPFVDGEGLLRVGGRLDNANLTFDEKHPIILPRTHQFSKLIIKEAHHKTLHGGNQITLAYLRRNYWIINAKNSIRHIIHNCLVCSRTKASASQQLMGILPIERVLPSSPFTNSGVDYAGPISLKLYKGRCNKICKGYIAVFICMATKAVHLELVSDLTTEAFLAAFKRFTSRRGLCLKLFSDCGTNFVGASNVLKKQAQQQSKELGAKLAEKGTDWHFIPPGSPHFGGLWEAGVKSTKQHIRKILGGHTLTFEEFSTILAQVEACLNSRPLAPLSNDIDDDSALTPGHFLIGRPMIAVPEPDMTNLKYASRWNLLTKLTQLFWKKWGTEYLSRLQRRPKWLKEQPNMKEGELVLIKDELLASTRWPLARIIKLHHGSDGLVRVVTVKQGDKCLTRNITKICRLPISGGSEEAVNQDNSFAIDNPVPETPQPKARESSALQGTVIPNIPQPKVKASSTSKINRVMCFLAMLMVIAPFKVKATDDYQVSFWNNTPGIYFEEMGTIRLLASRWKIVVHFDLNGYFKEIANIMGYIHILDKTCSHLRSEEDRHTICEVIHQQLSRQLITINQQNRLIQKFNKQLRRAKRGLGDSMGLVLGDMFGVLTHREAEHYENAIIQTRHNEEHLLNLLKNQTSIIDTTVNIVKHDHDISAKHFDLLHKDIQTLSNTSSLLVADNRRHNKIQSVTIFAFQIMLVIKELQDTQNAIIDVLTHSQHGKIHPLLLTPQQLEEELRKILEHIPPDNQFPGGNNLNNLADIYSIMSVKYRITDNRIVFIIQVPLVHIENFQLFNQLAVPVCHRNASQWITPSTRYLAINKQRERYTPISQQEFDECILFRENQYICDVSPIYNKQSSVSACELNFLQHNTNIHPSCKLETSEARNVWIKTWGSNNWIFSLTEETPFDLFCKGGNKIIRLNGTGSFTFISNCVLRGNAFVITAVAYNTNEVKSSYLPAFNLTVVDDELNITTALQMDNPEQREDNTLRNLIDRIHLQQENEQLPTELNHHDVHHYAISYSTIAILIVLFIAVYLKFKGLARPLEPLPRPNMGSQV